MQDNSQEYGVFGLGRVNRVLYYQIKMSVYPTQPLQQNAGIKLSQ